MAEEEGQEEILLEIAAKKQEDEERWAAAARREQRLDLLRRAKQTPPSALEAPKKVEVLLKLPSGDRTFSQDEFHEFCDVGLNWVRESSLKLRSSVDALRDAIVSATTAMGNVTLGIGTFGDVNDDGHGREPLQERLRKWLERIPEVGAMSIFEDQGFDCCNEDDAKQKDKLQQVMSVVDSMQHCLRGLQPIIPDAANRLGESLKKAVSESAQLNVVLGQAHVHNAGSLGDIVLKRYWSRANGILPEYRRADELICVRREWMCSTILGRHVGEMTARFSEEIGQFARDDGELRVNTFKGLIQKAYNLKDDQDALDQKDVLSDQNIFSAMHGVWELLGKWQPFFCVACKIILDMEEDHTAIVSKLSEVVDHSIHCHQVKVKGFHVVMSHSARLLERHSRSESAKKGLDDLDEALIRFYACFQDYLDDHKERAFSAAFVEPVLFYFSHSDQGQIFQDNVVPHTVNWYLALLNAGLGAHLPLEANYSDDAIIFAVDFWLALKDECWQYFSDPEHFGRSWQGIPSLARGGKSLLRMKVRAGGLPHDQKSDCGRPKVFANSAVDPTGDEGTRRVLSLYLERFAHFFSRDFFVRKAFELLNSENKPEHIGFRKACATLYSRYRSENKNITEETLVEHVYPDDPYCMKLDIQRTENFLVWLKVLKVPSSKGAKEGEEGAECSCRERYIYKNCKEGLKPLTDMGIREDKAKEAWLACLGGGTDAVVAVLMCEGVPPLGLPEGQLPPPPGPQCPQQ